MEILNVKVDKRGCIFKVKMDKKKFLIVLTGKGFLRAGEVHNFAQDTILVEGKIELVTKMHNVDVEIIYEDIQEFTIPANIPHYFKFLEDSIIIEKEIDGMTTKYYPEYRKIVEEYMK